MLYVDELSSTFYKPCHNKNTDFMLPSETLLVEFVHYSAAEY